MALTIGLAAAVGATPHGHAASTNDAATAVRPARAIALPGQAASADRTGSITFIGTATVLIRYAGMTILTDPNFLHKGGRVALGYGLTALRLTEPALSLEQLPHVDLVLLSHFHGDHFDQLVQQRLDHTLPIVTTPQAAARLRELGFIHAFALPVWDTLSVTKGGARLDIAAMPGRHGPPLVASLMPQVMGAMLAFHAPPEAGGQGGARQADGTAAQVDPADFHMYISGDTLVYDDLRAIPQRYPDINLALLHLGGTRILGLVKVTMDGADGVRMLTLLAPRQAIPIHYDDYDVFASPLADFQAAVSAAGWRDRVSYLMRGDTYTFHGRARPGTAVPP